MCITSLILTGGDLAYLGVAAQILRKNEASGVQADGSLKLNDTNTLRAGLFMPSVSVLALTTSHRSFHDQRCWHADPAT